MKALYITWT